MIWTWDNQMGKADNSSELRHALLSPFPSFEINRWCVIAHDLEMKNQLYVAKKLATQRRMETGAVGKLKLILEIMFRAGLELGISWSL